MAAGPLLFAGCVAHPVELSTGPAQGQIAVRPGRPGFVVAAPHGTSDVNTAEIAEAIARRSGFGLVVATGFSLPPATRTRAGRRYQVNRPLEGVPGRPPADEVASAEARRVYEEYERRVREAAQGPLTFYVEVHGNSHRDTVQRIEVATVGVDRELALRLKALAELIRDAHLRGEPQAPRLEVVVEPGEPLRYTASGAKRDGILRLPERALHVELPKAARRDFRQVYTVILAEFVAQAAAIPPGR
ncbi:MAG TPA: hypothetical protein VFX28_00070 [Methylomirabilota bacterium]|nr:hypothetical protein [Methylomirabilota bacterium]